MIARFALHGRAFGNRSLRQFRGTMPRFLSPGKSLIEALWEKGSSVPFCKGPDDAGEPCNRARFSRLFAYTPGYALQSASLKRAFTMSAIETAGPD